MRGLRRHKGVLVWVAAIALLGNLLAAMTFVPVAAALADHVLGPIVICTTDGAKALPDGGGTGKHSHEHCGACTLHATPAKLCVALVSVAVAFPKLPASKPRPADAPPLATQLSLGGIRSRAPPLSA